MDTLEIVIENLRGSYKKFADSLDEYPILGVTFPTHYGYIEGYRGEDGDGLDIFLGSGNILGYITVKRDDVEGGLETKMFLHVTKDELKSISEAYSPVLGEVVELASEQMFFTYAKKFESK